MIVLNASSISLRVAISLGKIGDISPNVITRITALNAIIALLSKESLFAIDDRMWRWDYSPPYEWKINVMTFGKHYIKVYAYGDEIARDEMDIMALIPYIP